MTDYETKLRGARKRLRDAIALAPDEEARETIQVAVKAIEGCLPTQPDKEQA